MGRGLPKETKGKSDLDEDESGETCKGGEGVGMGVGRGGRGGGGVTEWSLLMSEVRLQNTELRMSLARVGTASVFNVLHCVMCNRVSLKTRQ